MRSAKFRKIPQNFRKMEILENLIFLHTNAAKPPQNTAKFRKIAAKSPPTAAQGKKMARFCRAPPKRLAKRKAAGSIPGRGKFFPIQTPQNDRKISAKYRKIPQNFRKIPQNRKSILTAKFPPCIHQLGCPLQCYTPRTVCKQHAEHQLCRKNIQKRSPEDVKK